MPHIFGFSFFISTLSTTFYVTSTSKIWKELTSICQIWIIFTHLKLWIASGWKFKLNNLAVKGLNPCCLRSLRIQWLLWISWGSRHVFVRIRSEDWIKTCPSGSSGSDGIDSDLDPLRGSPRLLRTLSVHPDTLAQHWPNVFPRWTSFQSLINHPDNNNDTLKKRLV